MNNDGGREEGEGGEEREREEKIGRYGCFLLCRHSLFSSSPRGQSKQAQGKRDVETERGMRETHGQAELLPSDGPI